jgi:hypothetical protein
MIKINEHGKQHDEPGLEPYFAECQAGNGSGNQDVQNEME